MRYTSVLTSKSQLVDFQKFANSHGGNKLYIIDVAGSPVIFRSSVTPVEILIDGTDQTQIINYNLVQRLKEERLLGQNFDYENSNIVTVSEAMQITTLGRAFCGSISSAGLTFSKYSTINDLSILKQFTSLTDISGCDENGNPLNMFAMGGLTKVRLPQGIKEIGNSAFAFCIKLNDILIPQGVTAIRSRAFYNCTSLREITIPSSVLIIENNTFGVCKNLKKVIFKSSVPPTIYKDTFNGVANDFKIIIPKRYEEIYRTTWKALGQYLFI